MATVSDIGIGATNITTLGTITGGTWNGTGVSFAGGGLGANITGTFSNGGILYSNASNAVILAGTATANRMLLSGSSTTPAWSTTTYPATTSANFLLTSTSNNVVGQYNLSGKTIAITSNLGAPTNTSLGANGNVVIGGTGATPNGNPFSAGKGITITSGSTTITVKLTIIVNQASSSITMNSGRIYIINNGATLVTLTLATSPVAGDTYIIIGQSSGGWKIAQNASQFINLPGGVVTTTGTGGSISSSNQYDCITIVFSQTSNAFEVTSVTNSVTYV